MCEPHDSTGEPGAGNRPAGFGERGEETYPRDSACGPVAKAPDKPPTPTGYAPLLDSTPLPQTTREHPTVLGILARPSRRPAAIEPFDPPLQPFVLTLGLFELALHACVLPPASAGARPARCGLGAHLAYRHLCIFVHPDVSHRGPSTSRPAVSTSAARTEPTR